MTAVDVVIPCYRYGAYLPTAIDSVLQQDGVELRILIIDDASRDGSLDIALALAATNRHIEVIGHAHNLGHIATFNEGLLGWARAEYTLCLSADDALTPGALRRAVWLLGQHPNMAFTYGRGRVFTDQLPPPRHTRRPPVIHAGADWITACARTASNPVVHPTALVRTATQHAAGAHRADLPHTHDLDMWLRLAQHGTVGYLPDEQAYWRSHGANISARWEHLSGGAADLTERLRAFAGHPAHVELAARQYIAREALHRACRARDRGAYDAGVEATLIAVAVDAVGHLDELLQWRALQLRRRIGARVMPGLRHLVLPAAARRARQHVRDRRRARAGVH